MTTASRTLAARPGMRKRPARLAGAALLLLALGSISYPLAIDSADPLIVVRKPAGHADAILVLGGDAPPRAEKTVALWRAGIADRVIISGDGDCRDMRALLLTGGISGAAIAMDCLSRNTWENALLSAPLLTADNVRSAVLVTGLFHSGRAMATLETICPGIEWYSDPVEEERVSGLDRYFGAYGQTVALEYVKNLVYRLRIALFSPSPPPAGTTCTMAGAAREK